jgi:glutamate synthase domain-containing protein 2
MRSFIAHLRGEQEHRVPVFLRTGAGRVRDEVKLAIKAGADGIVLLGLDTAPLSDPEHLRQYCRIPMIAAIGLAREALQENKALGEVSLIAGNGILTGADAAKALALGADAVAIQESALVALGSTAASKKSGARSTSDIERGGQRVAKYINSMIMEVALLARSLGKGDVHSLEFEDLAALTLEASLISGVRLAGE